MALMPKRVKHRKSQRGRIKGDATRGNRVLFGEFGLQATQGGWVSAATIEAGRVAAQRWCSGRRKRCSRRHSATSRPIFAPWTSAIRKWIPDHTRASTISSLI